jgi:hypothetical protein
VVSPIGPGTRGQNSRGSIEGVVVRAGTATPLSKKIVALIGLSQDRVKTVYEATSESGRFRFRNLAAGDFQLHVLPQGSDYMLAAYGEVAPGSPGTTLSLSQGETRSVRIELTPTASFAGRVLNTEGNPVSNALILVNRALYSQNGRRFFADIFDLMGPGLIGHSGPLLENRASANARSMNLIGSRTANVRTNKRGEYEIDGLEPGQYYVNAIPDAATNMFLFSPAQWDLLQRPRRRSAAISATGSVEAYVQHYYPSTRNPNHALPVTLHAGDQLSGIDINVGQKIHTRRVSGVVQNSAGVPFTTARVLLVPCDSVEPLLWSREAPTGSSFEFRGVIPGCYILIAVGVLEGESHSARVEIHVEKTDLRDIRLSLEAGVNIRTHLTVEGSAKPTTLPGAVSMLPDSPASAAGLLNGYPELRTDVALQTASGPRSLVQVATPTRLVPVAETFVFPKILTWNYRVILEPESTQTRSYLKSVRMGNVDILDQGLAVRSNMTAQLDIVVGDDGGTINGEVVHSVEAPDRRIPSFVLLAPVGGREKRLDLYQTAIVRARNQFEFSGVAPGEYRIYAWEYYGSGNWQDPNYLRLYEADSLHVNVGKNSSNVIKIKAIAPWR